MNKRIDTNERVFMSVVGPSGCGKTQLIFDMLSRDIFKPHYNKIYYFYQHEQPIFNRFRGFHNIEYINGVDFEMIKNLPSNGKTKKSISF